MGTMELQSIRTSQAVSVAEILQLLESLTPEINTLQQLIGRVE